ncbi:MAG: GNAT family N-acetyltransferase [Polyangiales bacterium]
MLPRIETARTVLCIPPVSAAPRVLDYFVRNRARFEPVSPPWPNDFFTVDFFERGLATAKEEFEGDRSLRLYVFRRGREDGPVIGAVNFTQFFRLAFLRCILGYSVDGAHEGQGLLREALEAAIGYVFDELRFHRIEANYLPTNDRSGKLLRRLGFDVQGYARDYLYIGGAWQDHVLTAKTNPKPMVP